MAQQTRTRGDDAQLPSAGFTVIFPLPCDAPAELSWFIHDGQFLYE